MRLSLFAAAALCVSSLAAHADTIFNLQNVILTNTTTASGTLDINTADGSFVSGMITSVQGTTPYVFDVLSTQATNFNSSQSYAYFADGLGNQFVIDLPVASLVGYSGGALCSVTASCGGYVSGIAFANNSSFAVLSGSLAAAATPEPSSFALLGTGLLGALGVARKRFA